MIVTVRYRLGYWPSAGELWRDNLFVRACAESGFSLWQIMPSLPRLGIEAVQVTAGQVSNAEVAPGCTKRKLTFGVGGAFLSASKPVGARIAAVEVAA